ncbi:MAG: LacI family DNA-binding transcriptional regulator [Chitinophagaceae bacterium]
MKPEKAVTIYDIASHLKISAATVSRGLQDHPAISRDTKKRILAAAKKLGYRTNTFAKSLRTRRTNTIGVIVPRLNSYFISTVLAGMETTANKEGYNLIISQSLESFEKEQQAVLTMYNKQVDGLLISLAADTPSIEHLELFFSRKIPVIFFDRAQTTNLHTSILIDNFRAAYRATTHLLEQGCKRLMHLGGNTLRNVYADRLAGFKQALKDHHIRFSDKLLLQTDLSEDAGLAAADYILELKDRPDGVFVANDNCAVHCMRRLLQEGVKIPEDIAFVGFNNDPITRVIDPGLTSINYPGLTLGITAIQTMLNHINGVATLENTSSVVLREELVIRASSLRNKNL